MHIRYKLQRVQAVIKLMKQKVSCIIYEKKTIILCNARKYNILLIQLNSFINNDELGYQT